MRLHVHLRVFAGAMVLSSLALTAFEVVGERGLPYVVEYSSELDFTNFAIHQNVPIIFKNLPLQEWKAFTWNSSYLKARLGQAESRNILVKAQEEDPLFTLMNPEKKWTQAPAAKYTLKNISTDSFLDAVFAAEESAEYVYFAGEAPSLLQNDISNELLKVDHVPSRKSHSILWIGNKGVTAQTHYDISYNFFTQLHGQKTFYLQPPQRGWQHLRLYPSSHPARRQAQVPFRKEDPGWIVATLDPMDVLFVPPFWFHAVESDTGSISLSTVSPSRVEAMWSENVLYRKIHFHSLEVGVDRVLGVRIFMEALLHILGEPDTPRFMQKFFSSRFDKLSSNPSSLLRVFESDTVGESVEHMFDCNDQESLVRVAKLLAQQGSIGEIASSVAVYIISNKEFDNEGVRSLLLHDYFEEMLMFAVGGNGNDVAAAIDRCWRTEHMLEELGKGSLS